MATPDSDDDTRRANNAVMSDILDLERAQPRIIREHLLGDPTAIARLKAIDDKMPALRAKLKGAP